MGQEIEKAEFNPADFKRFQRRLTDEMLLLRQLFVDNSFSSGHEIGGYELEAWLVDQSTHPAPVNQEFISQLSNPLVVPELSRFNVELNSVPHELSGRALNLMHEELAALWQSCVDTAATLNTRLAMMGTLPVLDDTLLTIANMSEVERYPY